MLLNILKFIRKNRLSLKLMGRNKSGLISPDTYSALQWRSIYQLRGWMFLSSVGSELHVYRRCINFKTYSMVCS